MHIVLGLLTSLITILYLLDRMGINLGGLNPFYWRRRRAWAKKYEGDPIYAIDDPMEVAALFVVAVAKLQGDITLEQKNTILSEFSPRFSLDDRESSQLLGSSTHLLGQPQVIRTQLDGLLSRNDNLFSPDQAESLVAMMQKVASSGESPSAEQQEIIAAIKERYVISNSGGGPWGKGA